MLFGDHTGACCRRGKQGLGGRMLFEGMLGLGGWGGGQYNNLNFAMLRRVGVWGAALFCCVCAALHYAAPCCAMLAALCCATLSSKRSIHTSFLFDGHTLLFDERQQEKSTLLVGPHCVSCMRMRMHLAHGSLFLQLSSTFLVLQLQLNTLLCFYGRRTIRRCSSGLAR